jgi:hypothetical protein
MVYCRSVDDVAMIFLGTMERALYTRELDHGGLHQQSRQKERHPAVQ